MREEKSHPALRHAISAGEMKKWQRFNRIKSEVPAFELLDP
jgi:hypothetical protein